MIYIKTSGGKIWFDLKVTWIQFKRKFSIGGDSCVMVILCSKAIQTRKLRL